MSAPLVVSIPHRLGREEAARRLRGGLSRAAASVPVLAVDEERWDGDQMFFRVRALGQAASGHIDVADDHVRLEVTLPWLLQRFAEMAQATQPLQSSPPADQDKAAPAESKPGGERPTTPAPEPARPDAEAQKEGAKPALPPAPAEKMAPPIQQK